MKKIQDMKIDINTMCNFEKNTGRSLMKAMKDESFGLFEIRGLIQAGLEVEEEVAGTMMQDYLASDEKKSLMEVISEKLAESGLMGKKKDEEGKK